MKHNILTTTVAALAMVYAFPAFAGDYNSGIVTKTPGEEYTDVEFGSGWYLRGDIGIGIAGSADVSVNRAARSGDLGADADTDYNLSVGFGYIFNDYVRADVTLDKFSGGSWSGGASGCGNNALGVPFTGSCSSSEFGSFESENVNFNAYLHLGRFANISPYVGAGIGFARVNLTGGQSIARCTVDPGENCDLGTHSGATANPENFTGATQSFTNHNKVHMLYSLMAGFDYKLDDRWSTDISYRYTNIMADSVIGGTAVSGSLRLDDIELHEVRAGIRYEIW